MPNCDLLSPHIQTKGQLCDSGSFYHHFTTSLIPGLS